jgi:hypothetical protein
MKTQLVEDIRSREENHQILIQRRDAAEKEIAHSSRTIEALKAALTDEEKIELNPPAVPQPAAPEAPELKPAVILNAPKDTVAAPKEISAA